MIKIEEKTKIIVIDGEPGMLLLEFAVITRDLKKILPKGFAEKLEEAFNGKSRRRSRKKNVQIGSRRAKSIIKKRSRRWYRSSNQGIDGRDWS